MNKRRFKDDCDAALAVMWDYNEVIAAGVTKRREADLPYGKLRIRNAITFLYAVISSERGRQLLAEIYPQNAADVMLADQFAAGLYVQLTALPEFLGPQEGALRDRVMSRFGGSFASDGLYVPEAEPERHAKARAVVSDPQAMAELEQWLAIEGRIRAEGDALLEEAASLDPFA